MSTLFLRTPFPRGAPRQERARVISAALMAKVLDLVKQEEQIERELATIRSFLKHVPGITPTAVSYAEAGRQLGISARRVAVEVSIGTLLGYVVGRERRISLSEIRRFKEERDAPPVPEQVERRAA